MHLVYEHNLGAEKAYEKVGQIIDKLQLEYGEMIKSYDCSWSDDRRIMEFTIDASGTKVKGSLALDDNNLIIDGNVRFVVRALFSESKLEQLAKKQLNRLFGD